jgi:hypothetical protein
VALLNSDYAAVFNCGAAALDACVTRRDDACVMCAVCDRYLCGIDTTSRAATSVLLAAAPRDMASRCARAIAIAICTRHSRTRTRRFAGVQLLALRGVVREPTERR